MHTLVFYDGKCGLCHRTVRFLLKRDRDGSLFRYAPLYGETFETFVPAQERASLPDSVVVRTRNGLLLVRSDGIFHLLKLLGGVWAAMGTVGSWIPRGLSDWAYDRIASIRTRLFSTPDDACPVVARELRSRFDR